MARQTFFSFHYQRDIWRVNQVRNSYITQGGQSQTFYDRSLWEETQRRGDAALQKLIDEGLANTSVTVVLVGAETDGRRWVDYEIEKSYNDGKGLLAVRIHRLCDRQGYADSPGKNPFDRWWVTQNGQRVLFSQMFKTYEYVGDDGYNNLSQWIETAAKARGR
jgi:hypothetical protein